MATYIPLIYFLLTLSWVMLVVGYYFMKDFTITFLTGLFMMVLGIWITSNGIDNSNNLISLSVGLIHFGAGAYVTIRSAVDLIGKNKNF